MKYPQIIPNLSAEMGIISEMRLEKSGKIEILSIF
jgi:hypothetical protein